MPHVMLNLRTIKALWHGVNCTPTMMSSKLINEDPCSNHRLLDGVGNIINNVYSSKHVKHDKDEFIRYNCSQQIDKAKKRNKSVSRDARALLFYCLKSRVAFFFCYICFKINKVDKNEKSRVEKKKEKKKKSRKKAYWS